MKKLLLTLVVSLGFVLASLAQKTVSGRVTDANGAPLSNVSVVVKGTTVGTATGSDGTYTINVPADGRTLTFSSLGFDSQDVTIGNRTSVSASLAPAGSKELEGVVVTGINRVQKSKFAGAATKLGPKELEDKPMGFDNALQGRAPGLISLTASGAPGTAANVIIRGQSSIEGGYSPLYIVDGIPVETAVFQGMNPNDFASIDILRDAASTALYGARASSGVIVITTKRGQAGKMKVTYSSQMGVRARPEFAFRPMGTEQLLQTQEDYGKIVDPTGQDGTLDHLYGWWYSQNNPRYATLSPAQQAAEQLIYDSIKGINTNWQDEIFRDGKFSNHQITLSGGTGKTRIYSSIAKYDEEGITLRTDMSRITFRNNLDYADDKFVFGVSSNIAYTKRNFQQSTTTNNIYNPFLMSAISTPYSLVRNPDGSFATGDTRENNFIGANALELMSKDMNYNNQLKATLSATGAYNINDNWSLGLTAGVDFRETQGTNYGAKNAFVRLYNATLADPWNPNTGGGTDPTSYSGFHSESLTRFVTATVRPSVTFKKLVGQSHDIEVTALGEFIVEKAKSLGMTGYGPDPKTPNTPAGITVGSWDNGLFQSVTGGKSENALVSGLIMGRYTYNDKYTLTGSFRSDGSSKLPIATRWQQFFSVGAIWDAGREDFIRNIEPINTLRLKLSYGSSGNASNFPRGDYPYQAEYTTGSYGQGNTIIATTPGNPEMKWEFSYTTNFGVDFELFNRRLFGDVNIYNRVTKDLFIEKKLSATAGFGIGFSVAKNAGELSNKGVEVALSGDVIKKGNFTWTIHGNFAYNKNRVTSLGGEPPFERGTELIKEGYPIGTHYEIAWAGVDASTGRPLYYDANGNTTLSPTGDDRVLSHGTWEAPWKGGFGTRVAYKGFDLDVLFSWQEGSTKVDNMEYFLENPVGFLSGGYNQSADLKFWQQPGDVVSIPSPLYATAFSSKIIHDASFVRLRDVTLGYRVPKSILAGRKFISDARFFVQGSNLFIWTKWKGLDPEAGAVNINLSEFPNPRTITFGLDVTF